MNDLTIKKPYGFIGGAMGLGLIFFHCRDKRALPPNRIFTCPVVYAEMARRSTLPRSQRRCPLAHFPRALEAEIYIPLSDSCS